MLATLVQHTSPLTESTTATHILAVLPKADKLPDSPAVFAKRTLEAVLARRKMQPEEISKTPVAGNLEGGTQCVWVMMDLDRPVFDQQTVMRRAVQLLTEETPVEIHLAVHGNDVEKRALIGLALYTSWINGARLPSYKTGMNSEESRPLARIVLHGYQDSDNFAL